MTDAEIIAQVLAAFQEEQVEHRQAIGELLLQLEQDPHHPQRRTLLDQLFRAAHSMKGGARAAAQPEVEQLSHRMEDVFSAVRQGSLELTPDVCDPIYAALDAIGVLMREVAAGQPANLQPYEPLLATLSRLVESTEAAAGEPAALGQNGHASTNGAAAHPATNGFAPAASNGTNGNVHHDASEAKPREADDELLPVAEVTSVRVATSVLDALLNETGELITCTVRHQQRARDAQQMTDLTGRWRRIWRQTRPVYTRLQEQAPAIRPAVHYLTDREQFSDTLVSTSDRETEVLLNALSEASSLISDLEGRLVDHARQLRDDSLQLGTVAEQLHTQVRRTRMMPLAPLWGQLRLQVRDMARSAGKQVVLDIEDAGAEADRQVIDQLRDVMIHLLRNAVDHGIEAPAGRLERGKDLIGHVTINAQVKGDRLLLTVSDDGPGLDIEAIRQRAAGAGLSNGGDLARLSEHELSQMIFLPGFSTRQTVSTLSGRGVGLDIVRSNVERIHGHVEVASVPSAGCTFTISVPLSLTSAHGLLLQVGSLVYVLPLDAVQRLVAVLPGDVQIIEGRPALAWNERPLPLVQLNDLLTGITSPTRMVGQALILGTGERQIACLVDSVLGEQEVVQQRLPAPLQQVRFVAGATILADGTIAPILDLVDLLRAALGSRPMVAALPDAPTTGRKHRVLVVDDSITTRTLEKNILEAAGYQVYLAADGQEALNRLLALYEDGGCDLVLSDVDMPRLNGFELTRQIRNHDGLQHLPVVLVTSLDAAADRERGIAAGADAYIVKRGFDQQHLLETITQLI